MRSDFSTVTRDDSALVSPRLVAGHGLEALAEGAKHKKHGGDRGRHTCWTRGKPKAGSQPAAQRAGRRRWKLGGAGAFTGARSETTAATTAATRAAGAARASTAPRTPTSAAAGRSPASAGPSGATAKEKSLSPCNRRRAVGYNPTARLRFLEVSSLKFRVRGRP